MILKSTRRALIGVMLPTLLALCGSNSHADRQATSFSLAFAGGLIAPEKVIRFLDSTDSRIHRQYLPILHDGHTSLPNPVKPFFTAQGWNSQQAWSALCETAKKKGIKLYGYVDALRWDAIEGDAGQNVFAACPELQELCDDLSTDSVLEGRFASPLNQEVQRIVTSVVNEAVTAVPELEGICLDYRLGLRQMLGFSEAARIPCIREFSVDPLYMDLGDHTAQGQKIWTDWIKWRKDRMSDFFFELSDAARSNKKDRHVSAVAIANFYRWKTGAQSFPSQDWMTWVYAEAVDEIILLGNWAAPGNATSYGDACKLIEQSGKQVEVAPLLITHDLITRKPVTYEAQWEALKAQAPIAHVVVQISSEDDLSRAAAFVKTLQ
ncbi:MAG: family 10 glycosylhydrolase [Armatimonadetes bacterium]|nr:family 10 glycosylhydrolase [Armatimonadota bacterium]